jgi:hypothetical protein
MRVTVVLVVALLGCSSSSPGKPPPAAGGASGETAGAGGASGGGAGGGGAGGGGAGGAPADATVADASPSPDAAIDRSAPPTAGGKVLYIAGESPMVGTDAQIHMALKARGLEVRDVRETATPADAEGAKLIIMSYSMLSTDFKAEAWADVPVPIMVLEHFLLPRLGMTTSNGFQQGLSALTIVSDDPLLTAGLTGDVTVYTSAGKEMFWGVPGPGAIKVATAKGNAGRFVYFAYPAGAMMPARTAPAKRMQFFVASHAPPPVNDQILNADGLKLLGGAIDWLIK